MSSLTYVYIHRHIHRCIHRYMFAQTKISVHKILRDSWKNRIPADIPMLYTKRMKIN